ncbi:glycoside hydrolase family 5 protein [Ruminococcus sp. Marseille-P6503]|uniref:glycoside hydrolase family 5 protein n=1 Tax=Ruminococcus sp. Marseille-P6503 TaxID=2364796 RepID=UPI000F546AB9|nr:glycoside hydrolase family 5 protein [Ruminococcus sp. Marseille-P6503]
MNMVKKVISMASAAAMACTMVTAAGVTAFDEGTYTGSGTYISTYLKSEYYGKSAFKIKYKYNSLDSDGKYIDNDGVEQSVDYTDTFDFLVFDSNWEGWNPTEVGQAEPTTGVEYTATVSIADIEGELAEGKTPYGINLQTGAIGETSVSIVSLEYVDAVIPGAEVEITGSWVKGTGGTMTVEGSGAYVTTNEYNIDVSQFSVNGFENPTVDVTVEYTTAPNTYVQAELLKSDGDPVVANYPNVDVTGTYTYTTEITEDMTSFVACYDQCTVKAIHIYDNHEGNALNVSGKTANTINANLAPCWNLGNAFDSVDDSGSVGETKWGNPVVTEKLFQAVRDQGFKSVRIPVSYLDMVSSTGDINDDYLDRIQAVVDRAMDCGLYVIINVHHDGSDGVTGKWIDISLDNSSAEFSAVKAKFSAMWTEIAQRFANYNQALLFEGMNEVMLSGKYQRSQFTDDEFENANFNINDLNEAFVNAVRGTGTNDGNDDRCLIIPGYNTDINLTAAGFDEGVFYMPDDTTVNRLILSVHYYDPYDFTLNQYGTSSWDQTTYGETYMAAQLAKVTGEGYPVFIGEYCANFKNNISTVALYNKTLNQKADEVTAVSVSTAYWDNGVIGVNANGSGLIDRRFNVVTTTGSTIIDDIMSVYPTAS